MSQSEYLALFSDFLYKLKQVDAKHDNTSALLFPKVQQALQMLETLYLPADFQSLPVEPRSEFLARMQDLEALISQKLDQHGKVRESFLRYDEDGTGFMRPAEFKKALAGLEIHVNDKELLYLVHHYDTNHDGYINYTDFLRLANTANKPYRSYSQIEHSKGSLHHDVEDDSDDEVFPGVSRKAKELISMIRAKLYARYSSITDIFLHFDDARDSSLSIRELQDGLRKLEIAIHYDDLCRLTKPFVSADNTLSISEFANFIEGVPLKSVVSKPFGEIAERTTIEENIATVDEETQTDEEGNLKEDTNSSHNERLSFSPQRKCKDVGICKQLSDALHGGRKLRDIFNLFEVNEFGEITGDSFYAGIKKMNHNESRNIDRNSTDKVFALFDKNGNGKITYHEFVQLMQYIGEQD